MAKSIFEILDDLNTETSVPAVKDDKGNILRENHGNVAHTLPRENFPTGEQFENADDLLEWANDNGFTHAILQRGIQKFLIDARAAFKRMPKKDSDDDWSLEFGQENVDNLEWSIAKRPNVGNTKKIDEVRLKDCLKMVGTLTKSGQDVNSIRAMVTPIYGEDIVNSVFSAIENM